MKLRFSPRDNFKFSKFGMAEGTYSSSTMSIKNRVGSMNRIAEADESFVIRVIFIFKVVLFVYLFIFCSFTFESSVTAMWKLLITDARYFHFSTPQGLKLISYSMQHNKKNPNCELSKFSKWNQIDFKNSKWKSN